MFLCRQDWFYKGMTGITRASKESMFSDLNDPNVVTTTSEEYSTRPFQVLCKHKKLI